MKKKNDSGEYNFNDEIITALSKFSLNKTFTNFEIIKMLPEELSKIKEGHSIEWNKGKLKGLVMKTGDRRTGEWVMDGKVSKSEGIQDEYRLVRMIGTGRKKKAVG